jgi:hypothetical protein
MVAIDIDDYLTCLICKEIFSLPVVMISGCQHKYCGECFSGWLQELIETARRSRRPESLRCPLCRGVIRKPQDDLQKNRVLSGLVEDYWKAQKIVVVAAGVEGGVAYAEVKEPIASFGTEGGDIKQH